MPIAPQNYIEDELFAKYSLTQSKSSLVSITWYDFEEDEDCE